MHPGNSNLQISSLAEELARKSDDASRQQEEITHLLSQIVDLQKKAKLVWNTPPNNVKYLLLVCEEYVTLVIGIRLINICVH